MDGHLVLSIKERQRLKILERVTRGESTLEEAARELGLSYRQVLRIYERYRVEGDVGLVHRLRGRPSGRSLGDGLKSRAVSLYAEHYSDFGPTLASEMLRERDGITVHPETLRLWLVEAGQWEVRKARVRHRKQRERRACFGDLVQMDGSVHDWFEGRAPKCFLMSMVDDATGETLLSFAPQETTWAALELLERWVGRHGVPQSLYVDRKTVYLTGRAATLEEDLEGTGAQTQFGRACHKLGIGLIPAYSPQAKGRVERKHAVCQDRLVKEMRLSGIADIDAANAFLTSWAPKLNTRFATPLQARRMPIARCRRKPNCAPSSVSRKAGLSRQTGPYASATGFCRSSSSPDSHRRDSGSWSSRTKTAPSGYCSRAGSSSSARMSTDPPALPNRPKRQSPVPSRNQRQIIPGGRSATQPPRLRYPGPPTSRPQGCWKNSLTPTSGGIPCGLSRTN